MWTSDGCTIVLEGATSQWNRFVASSRADQPGTSIVLYPPAATPGVTDDERRTIAEMMAKGTFALAT